MSVDCEPGRPKPDPRLEMTAQAQVDKPATLPYGCLGKPQPCMAVNPRNTSFAHPPLNLLRTITTKVEAQPVVQQTDAARLHCS